MISDTHVGISNEASYIRLSDICLGRIRNLPRDFSRSLTPYPLRVVPIPVGAPRVRTRLPSALPAVDLTSFVWSTPRSYEDTKAAETLSTSCHPSNRENIPGGGIRIADRLKQVLNHYTGDGNDKHTVRGPGGIPYR